MNWFKSIPADFDISLAFITVIILFMTFYMGMRFIRRLDYLTVISFVIQLCMLTSGVLTVFNHVIAVPAYEIIIILFGIVMPSVFIIMDYRGMKKRIKTGDSDVPLIEKLEKKDNKDWHYEEYAQSPEEWKNEIPAGAIIKTLNLTDKQIKTNVTKQLSTVQKLIDSGAYKQALDAYTFISGLFSENPLIIYNTACLCYKNNLYEDSIKHYKKSLYIIGENGEKAPDKDEAEKETEDLRPAIHFGYGLSLYASKKFELAVNQFELAQKKTGSFLEAEINIAKCYISAGVFDEAHKHINSALKIKEDNKLRYLLARLCFEKNEEMECKYQLETIVANDRDFTEAWVLLGKLYRKSGDWENSQIAYQKLTQLTPQDADAYYRLGIAQREVGKTQEALANFKFATELMPDHSRVYYSMASIYDAEGNTESAIECLTKSLDGNEKLEMAYNLLAEIYISNDRVNDAIHIYEECIREYPESYLVHYNLGVSLMMMKRYEEAVRLFKRAHKLTSDDPCLYYNWASAVIGLKNYSEAARLYKEGLKLKSDDDEILFGLARISALQGDVDATLGFLSQAFEVNPDLRLRAKASHDFSAFRTLPEFMEITKLPIREEQKNA
jgi:tetratricopeptide (TPR) repeat protein